MQPSPGTFEVNGPFIDVANYGRQELEPKNLLQGRRSIATSGKDTDFVLLFLPEKL